MAVKQDVNEVEESSTLTEQAVEETVDDTTSVTPEQEETEATEEETTPEQGHAQQVSDEVDEKGVPWKNRAMEWQRKFQETANEDTIKKVVTEVLQQNPQTPKEREYTIEELEKFAMDNPEHRPWVENQKALIIQKNVAKITEDKIREVDTRQREQATRQQAEQWVTNHPRLKDCFVSDPLGRKVWNNSHPLTQMIGGYMREVDLQKRPDGLVVATKLALADYMDYQATTSQKKVKTLQQSLKKAQKSTLVEGGTSQQDVVKNKSAYNKAFDVFQRSGSKEALRDVLKAKLGIEE